MVKPASRAAGIVDLLDLEADAVSVSTISSERRVGVEVVLEPGEGEFHGRDTGVVEALSALFGDQSDCKQSLFVQWQCPKRLDRASGLADVARALPLRVNATAWIVVGLDPRLLQIDKCTTNLFERCGRCGSARERPKTLGRRMVDRPVDGRDDFPVARRPGAN